MPADFPYDRAVDQEAHSARGRGPAKARPSLEQAIARAQDAVQNPKPTDLVEARKAELDEELREHGQKRLSEWEWDGEVLACTAVRLEDQKKERVYARVPGLRGEV